MNPETTKVLETPENSIDGGFSSNRKGEKRRGIMRIEMWGRRKTVQSWGFGERTRLGQKGSLVRGRRRRRRRRRRGNRIIFRRALGNYLRENSNWLRLRRCCFRPCPLRHRLRRCCIGLLLQTMMVMKMLLLIDRKSVV